MSNDRIAELRRQILSGGPSLQEMHDFAMRDFALEHAVREVCAIEKAQAGNEFPVRVGNFIVKDKNTLTWSRPPPPYSLAGND